MAPATKPHSAGPPPPDPPKTPSLPPPLQPDCLTACLTDCQTKQLPPRTIAIGRLRKDAKLYRTPEPAPGKSTGRPGRYGVRAPTPEQLRTDAATPWETITFAHSGLSHALRFKRMSNLLWRAAGVNQLLQLLVIAPLAYRLRKGSKLLYRQPAFLLCTDPELDPRQVIGTYFQRWDIEVNFSDETTLLGAGQAQVRNAVSVQSASGPTSLLFLNRIAITPPRGANEFSGVVHPTTSN